MIKKTELLLSEMIRNTSISRFRHFYEAERHNLFNRWLSVPVVLINITLGSAFFALLDNDIPDEAKWAAAALALIAALLSGILAFFNFNKSFVEHRILANKYLEIMRKLEKINAFCKDKTINEKDYHDELNTIHEQYLDLNHESSCNLTSKKAFKRAVEQEEERTAEIENRLGG